MLHTVDLNKPVYHFREIVVVAQIVCDSSNTYVIVKNVRDEFKKVSCSQLSNDPSC